MKTVKKKPATVKDIEKNISHLLHVHDYSAVMADGNLTEHFILSFLLKNNKHAAKSYAKILRAYEKVKLHEGYKKHMESRKVTKETLQNIVLFYEILVRPIKAKEKEMPGSIYYGKILKIPKVEYDEGEQWKAALHKEEQYREGDIIFYNMRSSIILDHELLHLVGAPIGKLLNNNNI